MAEIDDLNQMAAFLLDAAAKLNMEVVFRDNSPAVSLSYLNTIREHEAELRERFEALAGEERTVR